MINNSILWSTINPPLQERQNQTNLVFPKQSSTLPFKSLPRLHPARTLHSNTDGVDCVGSWLICGRGLTSSAKTSSLSWVWRRVATMRERFDSKSVKEDNSSCCEKTTTPQTRVSRTKGHFLKLRVLTSDEWLGKRWNCCREDNQWDTVKVIKKIISVLMRRSLMPYWMTI